MDIATFIGLIVAFGAVGGSFLLEGGHLTSLFLTAPMLVVIGGTLGATTITTSIQTVVHIPHYLKVAAFGKSYLFNESIDTIVKFSEKARRQGILGLEEDLICRGRWSPDEQNGSDQQQSPWECALHRSVPPFTV